MTGEEIYGIAFERGAGIALSILMENGTHYAEGVPMMEALQAFVTEFNESEEETRIYAPFLNLKLRIDSEPNKVDLWAEFFRGTKNGCYAAFQQWYEEQNKV